MNSCEFKFFLFGCVTVTVISIVTGAPPPLTNLKHTFGSKDEIPAAFFESTPLERSNTTRQTSERRVYPACQDGSGGMCVDAGTCPSKLKPERNEPGACASGQECCFGAPSNDKTCASRGGECIIKKDCGKATPTFLDAVDCDQKNGRICCIQL